MRILWPVMPPQKVRVDAKFLDPRYPAWRKSAGLSPAEHPGIDINLQGTSGDGDYGYPVVAFAEGRVVHAAQHRVWGWVVLLEHPRVPGYPKLWSQYAHLAHVSVVEGQWVLPGEALGSIGKGDPRNPFLAHLHFELRKEPLPPDFWPGMDRAAIVKSYLDPEAYLQQYFDSSWRLRRGSIQLLSPLDAGPFLVNLDPAGDKVWVKKV